MIRFAVYIWLQLAEVAAWLQYDSVRRQWRFLKIIEGLAQDYRRAAVPHGDSPGITASRVTLPASDTIDWVRVMNGDTWFQIRIGRHEISIQSYNALLYKRCLAAWQAITQ